MANRFKEKVNQLLSFADVQINGNRPWDIQIHDERFFRMWKYYLLSFAGTFRARSNQLWQIVLSKRGVPGGYESVR